MSMLEWGVGSEFVITGGNSLIVDSGGHSNLFISWRSYNFWRHLFDFAELTKEELQAIFGEKRCKPETLEPCSNTTFGCCQDGVNAGKNWLYVKRFKNLFRSRFGRFHLTIFSLYLAALWAFRTNILWFSRPFYLVTLLFCLAPHDFW